MNRFLAFLFVAALIAPLCWYGCSDEPNGPETYTFDRYDKNSRFLGTATAYYCSTSSQFQTAMEDHGAGDVIHLTNADTLFTSSGNSDTRRLHGTLSGLAEGGPSKVQFLYSGSQQPIILDEDVYGISDIEFNDDYAIATGAYGDPVDAIIVDCSSAGGVGMRFISYNDPFFNVFNSEVWEVTDYDGGARYQFANCVFTTATEACDGPAVIGTPSVAISTWEYDGDDFAYSAIGTPIEIPSDSVSYDFPGSGKDLFVRFHVPGWNWRSNEDIIDIDVEYGKTTSYGSTYENSCYNAGQWVAKLNVRGYSNQRCHWRVVVTLCDSTWTSGDFSSQKILAIGTPFNPWTPSWYGCN